MMRATSDSMMLRICTVIAGFGGACRSLRVGRSGPVPSATFARIRSDSSGWFIPKLSVVRVRSCVVRSPVAVSYRIQLLTVPSPMSGSALSNESATTAPSNTLIPSIERFVRNANTSATTGIGATAANVQIATMPFANLHVTARIANDQIAERKATPSSSSESNLPRASENVSNARTAPTPGTIVRSVRARYAV